MVVPKIIWSLWFQGWDSAPDLVRACAASWSRLNPGWELRRLTRAHVDQLLPDVASIAPDLPVDVRPATLSEVVRIELLARYGGVWTDATTYCLAPLDQWLGPAVASGFFAFDRPSPDRMLADWFLAAVAGSPAILRWRDLTYEYWTGRTEWDAYFWCHYLFATACGSDNEVRRVWNSTPKISAAGPYSFAPYRETLLGPVTKKARSIVETARFPLLKLTNKLRPVPSDHVTLWQWLCDRERELGTPGQSVVAWAGAFRAKPRASRANARPPSSQAANGVLTVNEAVTSMQSALVYLNAVLKRSPDLMDDLVNRSLISSSIAESPPDVGDREIDTAVEQFRSGQGLSSAAAVKRWLDDMQLTMAALRDLNKQSLQMRKFKQALVAKRVRSYFDAHRREFDRVAVIRLEALTAHAAKSAAAAWRRSGTCPALDGKRSPLRNPTGALETLYARDLPANFGAKPANSVVGPARNGSGFWVGQVLKRTPARLDRQTRGRIEALLFDEWLAEQKKKATIRWHWV